MNVTGIAPTAAATAGVLARPGIRGQVRSRDRCRQMANDHDAAEFEPSAAGLTGRRCVFRSRRAAQIPDATEPFLALGPLWNSLTGAGAVVY